MIVEITENETGHNKKYKYVIKFKNGNNTRTIFGKDDATIHEIIENYKEFLLDETEKIEKVAEKL